MKDLLEREGYTVAEARDGVEALDEVDRRAPDVIILDLNLPGLDGYGVLQQIRSRPATRHIPVVVRLKRHPRTKGERPGAGMVGSTRGTSSTVYPGDSRPSDRSASRSRSDDTAGVSTGRPAAAGALRTVRRGPVPPETDGAGPGRRVSCNGFVGAARGVRSGPLRGASPNLAPHSLHAARRATARDCDCRRSSGPAPRSRLRTRRMALRGSAGRTPQDDAAHVALGSACRPARRLARHLLGIAAADVLLRDVQPIHLRQRSTDPARDRRHTHERSEQLAPSRRESATVVSTGRRGIGRVDLVALVDVIVAAHHVRHRPAQRGAQGAERGEVLVAELAAARRPVRQLLPRARMRARPDEIGQAPRIVPVPAFPPAARADRRAESRRARRAARRERTARAARVPTIAPRAFRRGRSIRAPGSR